MSCNGSVIDHFTYHLQHETRVVCGVADSISLTFNASIGLFVICGMFPNKRVHWKSFYRWQEQFVYIIS